jgi:PIN domain nuclease of toxin-antitoxin system
MRGAKVFDSWALLAFFQNRGPAAVEVEKIISSAVARGRSIYFHSVNWTELYATLESAGGMEVAADTATLIAQLPIEIIGGDNLEVCRQAAWHKTAYGLPLGASFAAGLAYVKKAQLVTGDPQFLPLRTDMTLHWLGDPGLIAENAGL